jgi:tetratricopeptide (TPR) repeat protein
MAQVVGQRSSAEEVAEIMRQTAAVKVVPLPFLQAVMAGAPERGMDPALPLVQMINAKAEAYVHLRGQLLLRLFKNPADRPRLEAIAKALEQGAIAQAEDLLLRESERLLALAEERLADGPDTGWKRAVFLVPAGKMRGLAALAGGLGGGAEACRTAAQRYAEAAAIVETSDLGLACEYSLMQAMHHQQIWREHGDAQARDEAVALLVRLLGRFKGQSFSRTRERALDALVDLLVLAPSASDEPLSARLRWAEEYCRAALGDYSRHRPSLPQAVVLAGLGKTLLELGLRENGTNLLQKAVLAFRLALRHCRRLCTPRALAEAWRDYGYALLALGGREPGPRRLERAVRAFQTALREMRCSREPLAWALLQDSMGIALAAIGERTNNTDSIKASLAFFRNALDVFTREQARRQRAVTLRHMENAQECLARNIVRGLTA